MLIELVFGKVLDFLRRDFEEENVKVEVYREGLKLISLEGVLDMSKGAEYTIPRWVAAYYAKKGYVKIKDSRISVEDLSVLSYNEEAAYSRTLTNKLKGFFYKAMFTSKKDLVEQAKRTGELLKLDEVRRIEDALDTLLKSRMKKIVGYSLISDIQQDIIEKLSEEEKYLLHSLRIIIDSWRRSISE
ncbi:hypothetical protein ACSU1N_01645 [Thermogladius sp. 4427co]|uniref:hypothetical protein n=1 Tax=Thermogladius sp. 4427co TaxID=3450718 RepID=UPI003F798121